MANLEFYEKHNMIAYLQKSKGSEGFHQIIGFLNASHIQMSATREVELTTTIDGQEKTITEASLRRHLKLEDNGGVTTLPNSEIFEQLALMGYATDSHKLTFQKVIQEKISDDTEVTTTDTALNTASVLISTTSATPEVSTTAANLVYIRRSAEKRKDKGKAIMIKDEFVQKKSKKKIKQERLSYEEAIRLQEHVNEDDRKRIARDAEICYSKCKEEYIKLKEEAVLKLITAHEVIEYGNSFKPVARTTTNADGSSTSTILGPVTTEEKAQKKNNVKARSMLLMALPNEHQLTFSQYKDAKTFASSQECLDSISNMLQKIISQLVILDENISQEDLNFKFLRSLPSEWSKHVVVWRNKPDLGIISFDDLYNNFKIVEQEVKRINTASTNVSTASTNDSTASLLRLELNKSEFDLATCKRGLASIEEQLVFYKKNEVMLCDQIAVLKRDASFRDSEINALNIQIEKLKKDKESNQIKIDKFENAAKSLDKLIGSQISDNDRKGVGYNSVPSPPTRLFSPPTIDSSSSGLKEFQQYEFEGYGVNVNKSDEFEVMVSDNVQHKFKPKPEQTKQPRKINENPRNNRTNWNEKKTKKLGVGFNFTKKACFVCGSFNHLIKDCDFHDKKMVQKPVMKNVQKGTGKREVRPVWNNALRTNHQNFSNSRRNFAPTAVLTKSGIVPISTARQRSSKAAASLSAARPINTVAPKHFVNAAKTKPNIFQKAHSLSRRPFNQQTALNNRSLNNKVNTAKGKRVTNDVGKQGINAGDPQVALKYTRIFDSGCSRHMTGNKSYLSDYQDYDGGFVAFAGSSKGGRITGKGKIKIGKLDFEDVYFVKELKFNMFSVSQMCDKKNNVLFTEIECLILSLDFKLPDENQVML
ncbi:hypothetical protein Tco_0357180 [Tanacetum coccineum]